MSDLISRQAAIDAIEQLHDKPNAWLDCAVEALEKMPSAQPEMNMDEWCTDCKEYDHEKHCCPRWNRVIRQTLKDAKPERKTGWWLIREGISDAQCSECKMYFRDVYDMDNSDAFCRHCGAKMEGLKVVKDE